MTTPRIRSLVSLAAALTVTLTLGGCASVPSRYALADEAAPTDGLPSVFQFDNEARDYVHVYLIGMRREWMLGRVAPGARATLRIPQAALAEDQGPMRLAVLEGVRVTQRVAGEARAEIAIAEPTAAILSQRWTFSPVLSRGQQLTAFPLGRGRAEVGRQ